jgi:hypothetical protein
LSWKDIHSNTKIPVLKISSAQNGEPPNRSVIDFIPLQKTSFANRQPDPAFQVSETAIFTPDICKA